MNDAGSSEGVIIWIHEVTIIAAFCCQVTVCRPLEAEMQGLLMGIITCKQMQIDSTVLEGDAMIIVKEDLSIGNFGSLELDVDLDESELLRCLNILLIGKFGFAEGMQI